MSTKITTEKKDRFEPKNNGEGVYCSLDIETSGFDPEKNELLEVGFVIFEVQDFRLKIKEEWTKVFKPGKEVAPNILGLTGIGREELDSGADFAEFKEFLQEKLGSAVIVGHNVIFDIKFLEKYGIKFSGAVLDTLDLVQFILPTHHSYNLENLMHRFGVSHKDAHRALADSKATLQLLEKLLGTFQSFPEKLKQEAVGIAKAAALPWADLLEADIKPVGQSNEPSPIIPPPSAAEAMADKKGEEASFEPLKLADKEIYNFPVGKHCLEDLTRLLQQQSKKVLLVVPRQSAVLALWKAGKVQAAFGSEVLFDHKKFAVLSKSKHLSAEEAKFVLKVLVWQNTNWQTKTILDLNLSFFGGQFKNLINGGKMEEEDGAKIVCMDLATFSKVSAVKLYKKRFAVIVGLSEFESAVSANIAVKVSWGYLAYILKSFYNPELSTGNIKFKDAVLEGLAAGDLFFGLVNAFYQTNPPTFQYVKLTPEMFDTDKLLKLKGAAENFAAKLEKTNKLLKSDSVEEFTKNLNRFFLQEENYIKWAELAVGRCVLYSTPLDITGLVKDLLKPFKEVAFADSVGTDRLLGYFSTRLGLGQFVLHPVKTEVKKTKQLVLFGESVLGKAKKGKIVSETVKQIVCHCQPAVLPHEKIAEILKTETLPAAVLFGSTLQIRQFYEANYQTLKQRAFLHAQSQSGGSSKIFHNFSIHQNSLLLATDKFITKSLTGNSSLEPVETLPVKTLILCHLPFEQFTHPYQEALAAKFANSFEDFSLPRAVYNLHCILQFFNTSALENIYISDAKLAKAYAVAFKDYIKLIPHWEMVEGSY